MRFFYQKAIDLGEKPNESDFSYPGPRPQSKGSRHPYALPIQLKQAAAH